MKEFIMLFHVSPDVRTQRSAEEEQANIQRWQDWIGGIAAQGKYVNTGRLGMEGKTLAPNGVVTDGPYAEIKEILGGYVTVKADTVEEALKLAEGCPALAFGGKVEVRDMIPVHNPAMKPA